MSDNTPQTAPAVAEETAFKAYKEHPADFVTDSEISKIFGISLSKLRNDRHDCRGLPYHKWGRMIRYHLPEVKKIFSECRIDPARP